MLKPMLFWISLGLSLTIRADPQVVVTIKPIHALVSGIMDGVNTPYLLLAGGESPHTYSLRPSQVKQLHQADLLVWIGPAVEKFLEKPLTTLSDQTQVLRLLDVPDLTLLKARRGETWENHHHHHDSHPATETEIDQHIWLDPHNAQAMVLAITPVLSQIDPNNAPRYQQNATRLIEQLDQLDQELKKQIAPVKELPFLVFHDAYQYFENRYGIAAVGSISLSPETRPSVKRLHELRSRIKQLQVRCVLSEPQFESALVTTLIEGTLTRRGILDPLGVELTAGTEAYFILLRNLAKSLSQCLLNQ